MLAILAELAEVASESWLVLGQMAPYLLFGFLMAGFLSVYLAPQWIERHLGRRGFAPVVKASLLGVPLPLCSCGVIPVSASIRRHGASRAATISFLLSTPQTGVDSIAVTYALLGPVFAVFRPIAALVTGLLGGGLVQIFDRANNEQASAETKPSACTEACCTEKGSRNIAWRALSFGFVTLPRDIGGPLLLGVLVAGALTAAVPGNLWQAYLGGGVVSILLAMALGVPIYVCATASVPIAAGLIHLGASPGTALAFLISGPATNAATVATTWKLLGRRTAALYLLTIALSAIACGLLLDWLYWFVGSPWPQLDQHIHEHTGPSAWISAFWAIALLLVIGFSYLRSPRKETGIVEDDQSGSGEPVSSGPEEKLQRLEFTVSGMTCAHCAETVSRAFRQSPGVKGAEVDLKKGRAVVTGKHLDAAQLAAAVDALGYEARLPAPSAD
jgi:uncharacterized membrane protein YraQ (UPF0718 family)/copper chaperone CopZ